jgi:hypothetical protein
MEADFTVIPAFAGEGGNDGWGSIYGGMVI